MGATHYLFMTFNSELTFTCPSAAHWRCVTAGQSVAFVSVLVPIDRWIKSRVAMAVYHGARLYVAMLGG